MVKVQVNSQGKVYTDNGLALLGTESQPSTKYGATIDNLLGDVNANGVLQFPTAQGNLVFTGVKDVGMYVLYHKFHGNTGIQTVSFPDLEKVSGTYALNSCFYESSNITSILFPKLESITDSYGIAFSCYYTSITSIEFPKLETVSGTNSVQYGFANCFYLQTARFPLLSTLTGSGCFNSAFSGCYVITDIYFNSLTTTSFGTKINQFNNMFNAGTASQSGSFTIHFPSNLETTIQGLTGYPTFGATASRITLSFDLDPTE